MAEEVTTGEVVEQSTVLSEGEVTSIVDGENPEEVVLDSDASEFEIPEKFQGKSIEDVIKSYQELEKFKGGDDKSQEEKVDESTEETSEPDKAETEQYNKYAESYDKNGSLSEAEYAELEKAGYTKEQVDTEITNRNEMKEYQEYKANKTLESVLEPLGGGQEKFKEVATWANETKTPEEVAEFNDALGNSSKLAQQALLRGLYAEYNSSVDTVDNILHTNSPQRATGRGYSSESEMFKDMNNPAYKTDPKFNKAVSDKLGRTNTSEWSF